MKEIKDFFKETGQFDTYVGDVLVINNNIILPIYNSQMRGHPLCKKKEIIYHLDYCYYVFNEVLKSNRDVYNNHATFKFSQTNYFNSKNKDNILNDFLLELVDFNGIYQYWNWIIEAKSFSIIVDTNYQLRNEQFTRDEMQISFFAKNHFESLKSFFK